MSFEVTSFISSVKIAYDMAKGIYALKNERKRRKGDGSN